VSDVDVNYISKIYSQLQEKYEYKVLYIGVGSNTEFWPADLLLPCIAGTILKFQPYSLLVFNRSSRLHQTLCFHFGHSA